LRPNCSCTAVKRVGPLPSSPAAFARTRACTRVRHRICRSRPSYPAQAYPGKRKSNYAWRLRLNRPEAAPAPDGADFRVESIKGQVTAMRQKAHGRQQPNVRRELPLKVNSLECFRCPSTWCEQEERGGTPNQVFTFSLSISPRSSLPVLKKGMLFGGTLTAAPVLGLRPTRPRLWRVWKLPNPRISTLSPDRKARTMLSNMAQTMISDSSGESQELG
jgi:hypothetical protein